MLGIDVNTTDKAQLQQCADVLSKQRPLVQQYVMDQVYAKMEEGNAWIAPYYAGDAMMMMEENEDLRFYLPENQNFNLFIDAMCIPTCSEQPEAAELFINFMCNPEISGANMDYICYGSPITGATEYMEEYLAESDVIYPSEEVLKNGTSYGYLPAEVSRSMDEQFMAVRLVGGSTEGSGSTAILIGTIVLLLAFAALPFLPKRKKKK
jgi:spermidine/putrescine transport system substrate-binding protein